MCAGSIDGIVQTGVFFLRNSGKVASGQDKGRIGAAGAQLGSLTDKVANEASIFGETISGAAKSATNFIDKGILNAANTVGGEKAVNALNGLTEGANAGSSIFGTIAKKAVNPLLITAAGIRILNDEDQYAALIEEGCAMGLMFGTEKLMTAGKETFFKAAAEGLETVGEEASKGGVINGIKNAALDGIKKAAESYKKLTPGGQTAAKIGIGLLFVAGSIGAYSVGKALGKKLSGRDEQ